MPEEIQDDVIMLLRSRSETSDTARVMVVKLPRSALAHALPHADVVTSIPVEPGLLEDGVLAPEIAHSLAAAATLQLAAAAAAGAPVPPRHSSTRAELLAKAKQYIDDNLHDSNLSPEMIASAIYVSRRYLHLIFNDAGLSVSRFIRSRRLACSLHKLTDHRLAHLPIADVASRLGFKDPSHFARVFKATYGMSPREYRSMPRIAQATRVEGAAS
jgi:AraC-like DNA-binding protein